jgi:hypothetical protein
VPDPLSWCLCLLKLRRYRDQRWHLPLKNINFVLISFKVLLEAILPLQPGPDCINWSIGMPHLNFLLPPGPGHEMTLEALIDAAQMLKEHLQGELEKLRQQ